MGLIQLIAGLAIGFGIALILGFVFGIGDGGSAGFSRCPYCKSCNTVRTSASSKTMSTILATNPKQWHCNNCGSDF